MNESVEQIGIAKPSIARNNGLITLPSGRVSEAGEGAESKVEKRREARPPREGTSSNLVGVSLIACFLLCIDERSKTALQSGSWSR